MKVHVGAAGEIPEEPIINGIIRNNEVRATIRSECEVRGGPYRPVWFYGITNYFFVYKMPGGSLPKRRAPPGIRGIIYFEFISREIEVLMHGVEQRHTNKDVFKVVVYNR